MRLILKNNKPGSLILLKTKIICPDVIKLLKRTEYGIDEIGVINNSLYLLLSDKKKDNFRFKIVLTNHQSAGFYINLDGRLFFYFDEVHDKKQELLSKAIIKIISNNIRKNKLAVREIIRFIETENVAQDQKILNAAIYKNDIRLLEKKLSLTFLKQFWPQIDNFQLLSISNNGTRINLIIYMDNIKYFLKIYADQDQYIRNFIKLYSLLKNSLNVPDIIDQKKIKLQGEDSQFWAILFEYIDSQPEDKSYSNFWDDKNIKKAMCELVKLHSFPIMNRTLGFLNKMKFSEKILKLPSFKYIKEKEVIRLIKDSAGFILKNIRNYSNKGLCHFDLHPRNFIISSCGKVYLIDLDFFQYDYIIFDLSIFIKGIILGKMPEKALKFIQIYYSQNKREKFDVDLIRNCITLILAQDLIKGEDKLPPDSFLQETFLIDKFFYENFDTK